MRFLAALLLGPWFSATAQELPIFDAHMHYSHDAWEKIAWKNGERRFSSSLRSD